MMSSLKELIEGHFANNDDFVILKNFTVCSRFITDTYEYAILDRAGKCIYLLADTVVSINKSELVARARHIPTVYGYLFYSNAFTFTLDGSFREEQQFTLSNVVPVNFKENLMELTKGNNITERALKDMQQLLVEKYDISDKLSALLISSLKKRREFSPFLQTNRIKSGTLLYRYMSNEAFFRIIEHNRFSNNESTGVVGRLIYGLASICSMNDRWEYSYGTDTNGNKVYFRDNDTKRTHIMSLSKVKPDNSLDMWRLYGEDTKGICLEFKIFNDAPVYNVDYIEGFMGVPIAPFYITYNGILYQFPLNHPDPIRLYSKKSKDYAVEKEARVILVDGKENVLSKTWGSSREVIYKGIKWIHSSGTPYPLMQIEDCLQGGLYKAPFVLSKVFIGPNASDSALKKAMIKSRLEECGIYVPVEIVKDFGYKPSK